jgi:CheY-like chemotaxis protein
MMGGTVTAASVMGQGSAFSLRFPKVAISARLPVTQRSETGAAIDFNTLRSSKVLVVDDNETNCQLIAGMFTGTAHRLVFATSGEEAIQKAADVRPDIILMDVRMPGMNGREALAAVRKIPGMELTPIIAVTASSLLTQEADLKDCFSGYIRKPFSRVELFQELAQFVPRVTETPGENDSALGSAETSYTSVAQELMQPLRQFLKEEWPVIRDGLAINETKAFASKLEALGLHWNCLPLTAYSETLRRHAENYAVVDMERHLNEFPTLVEKLQRNGS